MMNQGDCTGDIIVLDEALNCVASGVYLHCTGDKPDKTKPWLTECQSCPILLIVVSCNFSDVTKKVEILLLRDQRVRKVSWRLSWREMEEKEDSPEVSLSVVANFHTDIPAQLRMNNHHQNNLRSEELPGRLSRSFQMSR